MSQRHTHPMRNFRHLPGFFDLPRQVELTLAIRAVIAKAPLFTPTMPRTGKPFSVEMTNCGQLGWVSDKALGYRYQTMHPVTRQTWPAMPAVLVQLWCDLAQYEAPPEACLINYYRQGARMGSHQDRDEADFTAPVLSVSLGDTAIFHVGGSKRADPKQRIMLSSGDILLLEGESRLAFHGIDRIRHGTSTLLQSHGFPDGGRINLTLRRVSKPA